MPAQEYKAVTEPTKLLARRAVLGPAYRLFYDEPLLPVRGEDVWLEDADGRRYLDAYNNVPVVGHGNARVVQAMAAQAATLCTHTRYLHPAILDYADALLAHFPPDLNRLMLACTGSEANDLALRMAQAVSGGQGIVGTHHAYHGVTQLLAQTSPSLAAVAPFVRTVPPPMVGEGETVAIAARRWEDQVAQAFADLQAAAVRPCALLVDTVFASDGIFPPAHGLLSGGAAAARAAGAVVIADEVQAGFGRLGADWWGFARAGLAPDIVTMGKPMGNGYPMAGVVATAAVVDAFAATGRYFNTFGGNPVAAAVGMAVLQELEQRRLPEQAEITGQLLAAEWAHALPALGVAGIRGHGLYWGITVAEHGAAHSSTRASRVANHMRQHGVLISHSGPEGNVLKIRPPLTFGTEHVPILLDALVQALRQT